MNRLDLDKVPQNALGSRTTENVSHSVVRTRTGVELCRTKYPLYVGLVLVGIGIVALLLCFTIGRELPRSAQFGLPAIFVWGGICSMAVYPISLKLGTRVVFDDRNDIVSVFRGSHCEIQFPLRELVAVQICYRYRPRRHCTEQYELNLVRTSMPDAFERILVMSNFGSGRVRRVAKRLVRELKIDLLDVATREQKRSIKARALEEAKSAD